MTDEIFTPDGHVEPPFSDGEAMRVLAAIAGIAALAFPRRTRPLAGVLYGVALSRVHGAGRDRLERELHRLFDERASAHRRIDSISGRVRLAHGAIGSVAGDLRGLRDDVEQRIARLERIATHAAYGQISIPTVSVDEALNSLDAKACAPAGGEIDARGLADADTGGGACA